jgi:hypothetical protein
MIAKVALWGILAFLASTSLLAQQETVLRETCGDKVRIEATRERRLGGPDDPGRIGPTANFAIDGRGRFLIFRQNQLHVFDSRGAFVASFGRAGDGPGEYRRVRHMRRVAGDTIHILDAGNARLTVLSPDLDVVETKRLPVGGFDSAARLESGAWVVNAVIVTPDRIGWPLHLLTDGGIARSFGTLLPVARLDLPEVNARVLAAAGQDQVWAAPVKDYRLELWDTSNKLVKSLVRQANWFRPWVRAEPIAPDKPWNPRVRGIHLDQQGVLWVLIMKSKPTWSQYVYEHVPGEFTLREPVYQALSVVLEAVDVNRACILARLETDEFLQGPLTDGYYLAYHETADGVPYLDAWRLRIVPDPFPEESS